MNEFININNKNIELISEKISVPEYDRTQVTAGIVHIGVGGFHRAHQAFYTDKLLKDNSQSGWGICGICLLERDRKMFDALKQQDGLYTLMHKQEGARPEAAILGAIVDYYYAPENPQKVIDKMADPSVKIISLTITEGGYNFDDATGEFDWKNTDVLWDKENPGKPKTVFGYLTAALKKRKNLGLPVTIQSCDNIQQNGAVAKKMLLSFVEEAAPDLTAWIQTNVSFPSSMVDRITPTTTKEDIALLGESYGINDLWPVVSEKFCQWIIEDEFIAGRPQWEKVDVQFVSDVHPYEKMKIRILNGGHSLVGLSGYLAGYQYIHEAVSDPLIADFLKQYMDQEVTPTLDPIAGVDIEEYKQTVIDRFKNPYIKDSVNRIILESSAKIPGFILPVLRGNLMNNAPIRKSVLVVVCWYLYLMDKLKQDNFHEVSDMQRDLLKEKMEDAISTGSMAFLSTALLFGQLSESRRFVDTFSEILDRVEEKGIREAIKFELRHHE